MSMPEILQEFLGHVETYTKHRSYILKAKEKAGKFNAEVVQKVILDHEIKASEVADLILPLVPQLEEVVDGLETERAAIRLAKDGADKQMEEYQLRLEIEELSQEDYDQASAELREQLEKAGETLAHLEGEIDTVVSALDKWTSIAESAEQATGRRRAEAQPEVPPVAPPAPLVEEEVRVAPEVVVQDGDGSHVSRGRLVEDVSSVFTGDLGKTVVEERPENDAVLAIEAVEGDAGEESAEIAFGYQAETEPARVEEEEEQVEAGEVDIHMGGDERAEEPAAEIDISPQSEASEPVRDNRRALLLYQEGTAEEQIYPFTGDVLTIGRGRDNDIQIKNDSKVSRYHCKVFRRGSNFYIEDNKSSNGTLVNGELITERRLFGGEEVIIGETFFRFRIME